MYVALLAIHNNGRPDRTFVWQSDDPRFDNGITMNGYHIIGETETEEEARQIADEFWMSETTIDEHGFVQWS